MTEIDKVWIDELTHKPILTREQHIQLLRDIVADHMSYTKESAEKNAPFDVPGAKLALRIYEAIADLENKNRWLGMDFGALERRMSSSMTEEQRKAWLYGDWSAPQFAPGEPIKVLHQRILHRKGFRPQPLKPTWDAGTFERYDDKPGRCWVSINKEAFRVDLECVQKIGTGRTTE